MARKRISARPVKRRRLPPKLLLPAKLRKFLKPGKQTALTKTVRAYANRFPGASLGTVRVILADLVKFKRKKFDLTELTDIYAKRNAETIIKDRFVAVSRSRQGIFTAVEGCVDYNVALCAVLRAKGIPAKFTRHGIHSTTMFFLNGKWFEADPLIELTRRIARNLRTVAGHSDPKKIPPLIRIVPDGTFRQIEQVKKAGLFAEGLDAWDVGITSLSDFTKYDELRE